MYPDAEPGTRRAWPLSFGLILMACHQAYFIAPNWSIGETWEALRHVIGTGGLITAAVAVGMRFSKGGGLAGFSVGTTAAVLVIEVFVVAAAVGLGAWPMWIFFTWAGGMVLVTVSFYTELYRNWMIGLGSGVIAIALGMFVVRHFADASVGVLAALVLGIAGALLAAASGLPGGPEIVESVSNVEPPE